MRVVGLTGGIATGKSTVANRVRTHGIPVLDADEVARRVVAPGQPALQALVDALGPDILSDAGALDRPQMRQRISQDPEAKRVLESITHPAIRASMAQALHDLAAEGHPLAMVEAALLVETGSHTLYPTLWVVACEPDRQLQRLMARDGMSEEASRALIATQLDMDAKRAVATVVFENDGDLHALHRAVDRELAALGAALSASEEPRA